jgi:hypothetical protein
MTLLNFDTQIMKIYFNFHISSISSLKNGQTTGLVQKPYFIALCGRALTARVHFYSGNFM